MPTIQTRERLMQNQTTRQTATPAFLALIAMLFFWPAHLQAADPPPASAANLISADVCIYGGTSGGVAAAVEVSRMCMKAVIIEPGKHLGGMTAGGLSAVD